AKRKSDKERAQEQQEYAEFYQNYVDIRSGKKAPPKQSTSPWKAVKDQLPIKELKAHIEKQANHNEALQGLVNVTKALSGSIEKWGDRWEERREEHQLNELIPQVPDYLSKIPDEDIYFSRFTFEELVVKQQKLMTELNLLFGAVAVVGAFFTAGGSLYLLAIANGVWGVAQIGVSTMKLRDLNDGVVSDTSLLGINQEMLDVTGLMLGAVDLAILGKTLLKGANGAANNKYMKGIDQISTPKTRFKRGQDRRQKEMAMRVRQAVEESKAIRKASKDKRDLYFKKEKELYEALKKKKTSSSGSFGETDNLFNTLENLGLNTPQNMVRAKKLQAVGVTEENIIKVIQNGMNSSAFIQKKILNLDEFKYLNADQRNAVISAINDGRVDISKWTGKVSGELDGLTREEWLAIDKYMGNGNKVYRIPENAKEKVADFVVDGVKVEFKGLLTDTLEGIESKAFKYARESFTPLPAGKNADSLVLDVSSNGQSITLEQASNIANKIKEKYPNKTIEIWTSDGDVIK
ncbi:hypothetical protein ACFW1P_15200, partial [Paenibacillus sp. NPDC058910]